MPAEQELIRDALKKNGLNFGHWPNLGYPPPPHETSDALAEFSGFGQLLEARTPLGSDT